MLSLLIMYKQAHIHSSTSSLHLNLGLSRILVYSICSSLFVFICFYFSLLHFKLSWSLHSANDQIVFCFVWRRVVVTRFQLLLSFSCNFAYQKMYLINACNSDIFVVLKTTKFGAVKAGWFGRNDVKFCKTSFENWHFLKRDPIYVSVLRIVDRYVC